MPTTLDYAVRKGRVAPKPTPPAPDLKAIVDVLIGLDAGEYFEMQSQHYSWWTWCITQANGRRVRLGLNPVESIAYNGMLYAQSKETA
jgi:hypothetical protein